MADLASVIENVFPSNGSTGIVLNETIRIVFNTEMDESLLANGGLIVEGPDTDQLINADYGMQLISSGSEKNILESPGFKGILPGTFSFSRLDLNTSEEVSIADTAGLGNLYKTKLIFTPSIPLKKNTEYTVYLVGNNVKPRTVFDGIPSSSNSGNGEVQFSGSYTGTQTTDVINIRITKAGVVGVAEYDWWKGSAPLDIHGSALTSRSKLNLLDGVSVSFLDGDYHLDDEFSVIVKKKDAYEGIITSSFSTGSGNISAVPDTTATSPLGTPMPLDPTSFYVTRITPENGSTNLSSKDYKRIVIEFSKEIDPATVTQESVSVIAEAVINHPSLPVDSPNGEVAKQLTVTGNKLIIDL